MGIVTKIKKLSPNAKIPTYGDDGAIGADLYASEEKTIKAGERMLVGTGIAVSAEDTFATRVPGVVKELEGYFRVAPRSGLSVKGIDVGAGVVDLSYRGEIKVVLINNSKDDKKVEVGDRIAQLIFEYALKSEFVEVEELDSTERGVGGFGSTGK